MAADPKLQKVLQFYLPELFNHFRSVAEHRLSPAHFNVVKKLLWPYSQTQEKLEYLERLRGIAALGPMNELLRTALQRVTSGETKLSTLLSGIEVDSEKLVQIFEKIFRSVPPAQLNTELQSLGIRLELDGAGTIPSMEKPRSSSVAAPTVSKQATGSHPPDDFKRVGDFIAFFSERRARKKASKTPVDEASSFGTIDDETLKDFTDESTSLLKGYFQALTRLKSSGDDRASINEIRMAVRALATAARLLQIDRLAGACNRISDFLSSAEKGTPLSASAIQSLDSLGKALLDFVNNKPISLSALDQEVTRLSSRTEVPRQEKPIPSQKRTEPKTTPSVKKAPAPLENHHWIDELQDALNTHYPQSPLLVAPSPPPRKEKTPESHLELPVEKLEPVQPLKPVRKEPRETKRTTTSDKTKESVTAKPLADNALLNLMASNDLDADLDKMVIPTFMEKLTEEPKDLTGSRKRVRRVKKMKKSRPAAPVKETAPEKIEGQYVIQEINFANVDPEILEIFEQESRDYLKSFVSTLEKLSKGSSESALRELERTSHTLKSSARMLGFDRISGLAACLEIIAERFFEGEIKIDTTLTGLLGEMVQALDALFNQKPVAADAMINKIRTLENQLGTPNILSRNLLPSDSVAAQTVPSADAKPLVDYFTSTGVDPEIIQIFKEESTNYLLLMNSALDTLHAETTSLTAVKDIEKSSHSLRSSAKMLGFDKISRLARAIENISEKTYRGTMPLTRDVVAAFDASCQLLKTLAEGTDVDIDDIVQRLDRLSTTAQEKAPGERSSKTAVQPKAVRKKKIAKKSKLKFADVEVQSDPILKRLATEAEPLLEEMANATPK